ncbi:MAG: phage head closure protein [Hyphomicrobium sp.]|jgi:SPP1 family predicted phage head-tail adaptor
MSGIHMGELRTRVVLEAPERADDGGGGAAVTWSTVADVWARVSPSGGGEAFELDRVAGKVSHEIVIRYRDGVTPSMRFAIGARVLDIRAAFDPDGRRHWLRCFVEERDL